MGLLQNFWGAGCTQIKKVGHECRILEAGGEYMSVLAASSPLSIYGKCYVIFRKRHLDSEVEWSHTHLITFPHTGESECQRPTEGRMGFMALLTGDPPP